MKNTKQLLASLMALGIMTSTLPAKAANDTQETLVSNISTSLNNLETTYKIDDRSKYGVTSAAQFEDVIEMAYYQSPLSLGIKNYSYVHQTATETDIKFKYANEGDKAVKKQNDLKVEVKRVTKAKVKSSMKEEEKVKAIYDYLANNVKYDFDVFYASSVGKSDFTDSHNAYGAMLKKKAVCQGFAGAFQLMAEEAGLEVITVTGVLEGGTPHAWNKVKINGKWVNYDATNNFNTMGVPYYLFGASDSLAKKLGYKEDDMYALDKDIKAGVYKAPDSVKDYYKTKGLEVSIKSELKTIMTTQLKANPKQESFYYRLTDKKKAQELVNEAYATLVNKKGDKYFKNRELEIGMVGDYLVIEIVAKK